MNKAISIISVILALVFVFVACVAPGAAPGGGAQPSHPSGPPTDRVLPPEAKPHLEIVKPGLDICNIGRDDVLGAVGYVFPDPERFLALWAAPLRSQARGSWDDGTTTMVGVVGIGQDPELDTTYFVAIDLSATDQAQPEEPFTVAGSLFSCKQQQEVATMEFEGLYQEPNPAREEWPNQPQYGQDSIDVSIGADKVCFLHVGSDTGYAVRYCPVKYDPPVEYLSVIAQFPEQYGALVNTMLDWVEEAGVNRDFVLQDRIIGEYELPAHIKECDPSDPNSDCDADIIGAVLDRDAISAAMAAGLTNEYGQAYGGEEDDKCWRTIGVVHVINSLAFTIPGEGRIEIPPGSYAVNYWYEGDCDQVFNFLGATLRNVEGDELSIPAVPSSYCDVVSDGQCISLGGPRSEISAWHAGSCCLFWQSSCP